MSGRVAARHEDAATANRFAAIEMVSMNDFRLTRNLHINDIPWVI